MPPSLPANWPGDMPFFNTPQHCKRLTREQQSALKIRQPDDPDVPVSQTQIPSPLIKITPIGTSTHPAFGQYGLFATRNLPPESLILLYLGLVHGNNRTETQGAGTTSDVEVPDPPGPESDYDLWLDRDSGLAVDAARGGNEARFINDYRGISDRPNAEFREVWSQPFQQRCMAVFVLPPTKASKVKNPKGGAGAAAATGKKSGQAKKGGSSGGGGIAKGEEILVSYGKGFWQHRVFDGEAGEEGDADFRDFDS